MLFYLACRVAAKQHFQNGAKILKHFSNFFKTCFKCNFPSKMIYSILTKYTKVNGEEEE